MENIWLKILEMELSQIMMNEHHDITRCVMDLERLALVLEFRNGRV